MDFPTLPHRDLQALCKRNGIRANMKKVAMADALAALPTDVFMTIRATCLRKPMVKAVAEEEMAAPRAPRRGTVRKTVLKEEQEEPEGVISDAKVVPVLVSDQGCDCPGDSEEPSSPWNDEQNQVVDAPKQEEEWKLCTRPPCFYFVLIALCMLLLVQFEVSDVVIIEDEVLVVESLAENPLVVNGESIDKSALQEQQVNNEKCYARLANQEDSPILGFVSAAARVDKVANFQDIEGSDKEPLCVAIHVAGAEMEMVSSIHALQAQLTLTAEESTKEVVTGDANHESEMGDLNEVLHSRKEISEVDTEDDLVSQEEKNMDTDELVNEAILFDCSGSISLVDEEKTNESNTADGLCCQQKRDVSGETVLPDMGDEAIVLDCLEMSIKVAESVNVGEVTHERQRSLAAQDENGGATAFCTDTCDVGKQSEGVSLDNIGQVTREDGDVAQEKSAAVTKDMSDNAAVMDDDNDETGLHSDKQKEVVTAELNAKLKEKLNAKKNKEAKRVTITRVDENVCRSHSKGQQQNLNLQQH